MTVFGFSGCLRKDFYCAARLVAIATLNCTSRTQEKVVIATNGQDKVFSRDKDGNDTFETIEDLDVAVNPDTTRANVLTVKNADGSLRTVTNNRQSVRRMTVMAGNDNCLSMMLAA